MNKGMPIALIVGAGPVGLYLAIRLKGALPDGWHVFVVDKRATYTRQQLLLLWRSTIELLPREVVEDVLGPYGTGCWYESVPPSYPIGLCFLKPTGGAVVRVSALEEALLRYAQAVGVTVVMPISSLRLDAATSTAEIDGAMLRWDVLVGADGARSMVRENVLGAAMAPFLPGEKLFGVVAIARTTRRDLGGVFRDFKDLRDYMLSPSSPSLDASHQGRSLLRPLEPVTDLAPGEHFFRSRDGGYYITFAVDERQHKDVLRDPRSPFVMRKVERICAAAYAKCRSDPDAYAVTSFPLTAGMASEFSAGNAFIVGDAAITTHFLTGSGLNSGIKGASFLADLIANAAGVGDIDVHEAYDEFMRSLALSIHDRIERFIGDLSAHEGDSRDAFDHGVGSDSEDGYGDDSDEGSGAISEEDGDDFGGVYGDSSDENDGIGRPSDADLSDSLEEDNDDYSSEDDGLHFGARWSDSLGGYSGKHGGGGGGGGGSGMDAKRFGHPVGDGWPHPLGGGGKDFHADFPHELADRSSEGGGRRFDDYPSLGHPNEERTRHLATDLPDLPDGYSSEDEGPHFGADPPNAPEGYANRRTRARDGRRIGTGRRYRAAHRLDALDGRSS
jgi:2-polyprenyl-6-methoxyphenol hydroxylase-like FAD-dependent oxidoreductase